MKKSLFHISKYQIWKMVQHIVYIYFLLHILHSCIVVWILDGLMHGLNHKILSIYVFMGGKYLM